MAGRCEGQRILVTGAGSDTGRAVLRRFDAEGAIVLGLDADAARLEESCDSTYRASWRAFDVRSADAVDALIAFAPDRLVNVAEIRHRHAVADHPLEDWQESIDVNVKAMFRLSREFARARISSSAHGVIVNVASPENLTAAHGDLAYTASKSAVAMLTKAFALELAPHGIRVVAIAPLAWDSRAEETPPVGTEAERVRSSIPMRRFARPEELAAAIAFLASDEASYVTGVILPVDGGWQTA
jgi:NAD(P)-dependent dehydrogenase (short-subunit alcohol dehydrogenase family)